VSYYALEYTIIKVHVNQEGMGLIETHQLLVYADDINIRNDIIVTKKKNTETLLEANRKVCLEGNTE
jgi:hypothetical protein